LVSRIVSEKRFRPVFYVLAALPIPILLLSAFCIPLLSKISKKFRYPIAIGSVFITFCCSWYVLFKILQSPTGYIEYFLGHSWSGQRLLSTGELRKKMKNEGKKTKPTLHDLMETGKYAYNANVVWLLSQISSQPLANIDTLALEFAKNKLSDFKGEQYLLFDRPTGTIREAINYVPMEKIVNSYDEEIELGGENE